MIDVDKEKRTTESSSHILSINVTGFAKYRHESNPVLLNIDKKVISGTFDTPIPAHNEAEVEQVKSAWRRLWCPCPVCFRGPEVDRKPWICSQRMPANTQALYCLDITLFVVFELYYVSGLALLVYQLYLMIANTACPDQMYNTTIVNATETVFSHVNGNTYTMVNRTVQKIVRTPLPTGTCVIGSMETILLPFYATLVALWATIQVESWKRKQCEFSYKWDMLQFEEEETTRAQYVGDYALILVLARCENIIRLGGWQKL